MNFNDMKLNLIPIETLKKLFFLMSIHSACRIPGYIPVFIVNLICVLCIFFYSHTHQRLSSVLGIQTLLVWSSVSVNGFVVSHLHPAPWCSFCTSL